MHNFSIFFPIICIVTVRGFLSRPLDYNKLKFDIQMLSQSFKDKISEDISETTKVKFKGSDWNTGYGGGGGADVGVLKDGNTGQEYFCKIGGIGSYDMLSAEYNGVKDMFETATIRVPRPICCGCIEYNSYVVFEKISLGGSGSAEIMGEKLAAMHKCTSSDGMFGWKMNNTIGATFQPNKKMKDWAEFWDSQRLGHMLTLCKREGASFPQESLLRQKVKSLLESHHCIPSLVHGDLWSGNKAYTKEGDPVIFDPATYYGDREVDIAMTYLFGTFDKKFYESYNKTWPLPVGHEKRRVVYNLYHILNHYVLFGGGYLNEANSMIASILKF